MKRIFCLLLILCISFISGCGKVSTEEIESILNANITVESRSRIYGSTMYYRHTGSGVIFHECEDYYYFLTNNHVTFLVNGYDYNTYTITDYEDNYYSYDVEIIHMDPLYDLSVGFFAKGDIELGVVSLTEKNPWVFSNSISIGQPNGVKNTITTGRLGMYVDAPVLSNDVNSSNVSFKVFTHYAPIYSGSSGGGVFNNDLELIGINYAGIIDNDGVFIEAYAIPIEMVHEFLEENFWDTIEKED